MYIYLFDSYEGIFMLHMPKCTCKDAVLVNCFLIWILKSGLKELQNCCSTVVKGWNKDIRPIGPLCHDHRATVLQLKTKVLNMQNISLFLLVLEGSKNDFPTSLRMNIFCYVFQAINGEPLPALSLPQPENSFDANGKFVGQILVKDSGRYNHIIIIRIVLFSIFFFFFSLFL